MSDKIANFCFCRELAGNQSQVGGNDAPVLLFREGTHAVYWLGIDEDSVFRCNVYLVQDGDEALLVDPGGAGTFEFIRRRVERLLPLEQLSGLIISHQDPDIAASLPEWLAMAPHLQIFASPRVHLLLTHYQPGYSGYDIEKEMVFRFKSSRELHFIAAPFLHSPGGFVSFDTTSGFLFSSDIWAALDTEWRLVVADLSAHLAKMDLFNKDYMASNRAVRGLLQRLVPYSVRAILPQHGSLIPEPLVAGAYEYLWNLECGIDLHYPEDLQLSDARWVAMSSKELLTTDLARGEESELPGQVAGTHLPESTNGLRQALDQANRLAKLRDQALHDLKIAESRLKESEARLAEAQAIARIGYWDRDLKTDTVAWSNEMFRILGLDTPAAQLSFDSFLQAVHPDDRQRVDAAVNAAIAEDAPFDIKHKLLRPDGVVRQVHEKGRISRNSSGEPVRMLGIVHDITELTYIEGRLHSQNLLLAAIQKLQARFISDSDPEKLYSQLLDDMLVLTESDHGFIAETESTPEGVPYLRIYAVSELPDEPAIHSLVEKVKQQGFELRELDNLFGVVLTTGEPVISNDPQNDPRSLSFAHGLTSITAFIGIPIYFGNRLVGEIAMVNRKGGYSEDLLEYLQPLLVACGQIIVARQDQRARTAAEQALANLAKVDGLLGIPNRRSFDEYLKQQYSLSLRQRSALTLIMIDVDHFKLYNDHYGHQAGDSCLIAVAEILQKGLQRPADMVARYGGEEFCCILPETTAEGAVRVAEKIRAELVEQQIPHAASPVIQKVTVSMGIACRTPDMNIDCHALVALADQALYAAKNAGRNCIEIAGWSKAG